MAQYQGWTSGPNTRGSFDILWTCLTTMALCVWTAVHPNIPVVSRFGPTLLERLGLMMLAMIFPEFVMTAAWDQRRRAQRLLQEVNPSPARHEDEILREAADASLLPPDTSHRWSLLQALFAVMGGYALETQYTSQVTKQPRTIRRLVTPEGVAILATTGTLPSVSERDLEERSKADVFAKVIVVCQILWFALQVLGRLGQRLPVTLLETHTTIHVGCAIVVYAIWLHKPYNLSQSVMVTGPDSQRIGAFFNFHDISYAVYRRQCERYETHRIEYWKRRIIHASRGVTRFESPPEPPTRKPLVQLLAEHRSSPADRMTAVDEDEDLLYALAPEASEGLEMLQRHGCRVADTTDPNDPFLRQTSANFTIRTVWGGWSTDVGHEPSWSKGIHVGFNVLYGGCHLAAWSSAFPSPVERWLWRASALFLISVPVWGALRILWWTAVRSRHRAVYPIRNGDLDVIAAPMFFTIFVVYTVARWYFLIEALMSLRRLPLQAYDTVNWTSILPHVG
ncbi:uncharacterized protein BO80DRAFT_429901 [Aspergillus ibericus CBS 121593]|uniref:Uncharacterized protein n=1 Tax=Aspergillus ibericus CBS 121593 TaxID=1448316 RepID=A0A395GJG8_9EURO|nr:hypothetical protein BO80DRAFT_429901 [Aspergillus ibericus CBS 121593]RAK95432.1 hypothetical protein BO80DRAFT_429901 [Aspergillus ibericus CBS 121593]